ncbi:MAG: twin transmembrane helix small protein [Nitrosomonadaceae bacterium]|nr:twin transmembrane helix small protein [Nitrosospira sp.]MDW7565071.1 twin transmembrane helix small protein [Nitrosomonadaceae bacterium]MBI0408564.1 twin transmembrane helix small protein [Nitrosospira sp.]MBI0410592.1 twin transmembrane helix small protein [Nitrosospira sp.]MBI0411817.1 twin transmembrane helix small protein [Nitrosospira sp.]
MKVVAILFFLFIVGSLAFAMFYLVKDKGQSTRTVKALTFRIGLSVVLFALMMLGFYLNE